MALCAVAGKVHIVPTPDMAWDFRLYGLISKTRDSLSLFPNARRLAKEHVKCLRLETARGWRIEPWVCWLDHACITQHLRFYRGIPSLCCHHDIRVVFLLIGAEMLSRDIEIMIGRGVPVYMRVAWCFVNPALLLVRIYVFTWI